ncbi:MAG: ATP-binding cassette domain-containing protein, partial [Bacteroidales bacterium]|nr:ATP-binding cassette domain-containing protein [Bacteroidales bacterium]
MSEEILKALMQLFALIIKQDGGIEEREKAYIRSFLSKQLSSEAVSQYYSLFEHYAGIGEEVSVHPPDAEKLTPVLDSVKVLGICRRINKTLHQNQKIVVLVRLFELVNADRKFTHQRMAIINTVADVFKVPKEETSSIEKFITSTEPSEIEDPLVLILTDQEEYQDTTLHLHDPQQTGYIVFLHVPSVGLYFFQYTGEQELFLNGLSVNNQRIYLFANGSTVKPPREKPLYYSDVVSHFLHEKADTGISLKVEGLNHRFPGGDVGLRNINFTEKQGSLVGIMGASGAGKTTLLNILSGNLKPTDGSVKINGLDLNSRMDKLKGVIGLIPQDDLLIEELTVFQNLYYNASLCFRKTPKKDLQKLVDRTLVSLGLQDIQDLKVGTPFNKLISGGQRKRLNVALELLREPSVLFVDEPTSGLSSRDSENVMDLLRELALKGKLVFVVIHQPSSEIYKMFDRIIFLDTGGYMIYHGNPVEAVMYFKRMDEQINAEIGECPTCGNVYPELIFNIIEASVVDEFGNYTGVRKVTPERWEELYHQHHVIEELPSSTAPPPGNLYPPGWLKQFSIYWIRDLRSKISNPQYVGLTLL